MDTTPEGQELHHEIFGSILDRTEMTPFLLLSATDYASSLRQAARMMANRGFDTIGDDDLQESERARASKYITRAYASLFNGIFTLCDGSADRSCRSRVPERRTVPELPCRPGRSGSGPSGTVVPPNRR